MISLNSSYSCPVFGYSHFKRHISFFHATLGSRSRLVVYALLTSRRLLCCSHQVQLLNDSLPRPSANLTFAQCSGAQFLAIREGVFRREYLLPSFACHPVLLFELEIRGAGIVYEIAIAIATYTRQLSSHFARNSRVSF